MAVVDLHAHTTASDGRLAPAELVRLFVARGVRFAAVTDHDTTDGLDEALAEAERHPDLTLIPGIELSADVPGSEVHVLGYWLDRENPELQAALRHFRDDRVLRSERIVERLRELGLDIDYRRVQELAQGAVGRPHIAQALLEAGYVSGIDEAFDRYLGRNGPAYVERSKLTPVEAVRLIVEAGGAAVFAHPAYTRDYAQHLPAMKEAGLAGMEVHYGNFDEATRRELALVAEREGLVPCGGSDYHAMGKPNEAEPGQVGPPVEVVEALRQRAGTSASRRR